MSDISATALATSDARHAFTMLVEGLASDVRSILRSETTTRDLRWSDDGISMALGGSWKASIWNPDVGSSTIEITCTQGYGERWQAIVAPLSPDWPMIVLHWPNDDFEGALRAMVANLRL